MSRPSYLHFVISLVLVSSAFSFTPFMLIEKGYAQATSDATTAPFKTYVASLYGMTVNYPGNWKIQNLSSGLWFVSPADETGNIGLISSPTEGMTLNELVQDALSNPDEDLKDFKIISSNITTLAGNHANRTDYQFKIESPAFFGVQTDNFRAIKISAVQGDRVYTVTYLSTLENFNIFLPIFQKMLTTLKFSGTV